ncbi:MAG: NUDIX domain-containing protein [Clostridia bacterium]|nr:NUDIX domain-containing protein [Clostridia bacterium]
MKQEKSCGAVVYAETGRGRLYLVEKMLHGHFGLPKGHVEPGENEKQTAEREILEETGLRVSVDTRFREVTTYSPAPGVMKDVVFFVARAANTRTTPQPTEVESIAFLPLEKALTRLTYESDREVVRRADSYLSK